LTVSRIGGYVGLNVDYLIAGRLLGAEALGYYSRAYYFLMQPTMIFGSLGDKVLYPAFSSIQDDRERIARAYLASTGLCILVTAVLGSVLVVLAPEVIHLLLGPQWGGAVVPFQCLIAVLPFRVAGKLQNTVSRSLGAVKLLAAWEWSAAGLVALGAWMGAIHSGVSGLAAGVALAIVLNFVIGIAVVAVLLKLGPIRITSTIVRPLCMAILTGLLGAGIRLVAQSHLDSQAALCAAILAGQFLVVIAFLKFMPEVLGDTGRLLTDLIRKKLQR
jgi:PST family polysaccharide transporter